MTLPKKDESDEENLPDQQKDKDDSKDNSKQTQTKTRTKINRHWINIWSFDKFSLKYFNYCFDDLVNNDTDNDKDTYIKK